VIRRVVTVPGTEALTEVEVALVDGGRIMLSIDRLEDRKTETLSVIADKGLALRIAAAIVELVARGEGAPEPLGTLPEGGPSAAPRRHRMTSRSIDGPRWWGRRDERRLHPLCARDQGLMRVGDRRHQRKFGVRFDACTVHGRTPPFRIGGDHAIAH